MTNRLRGVLVFVADPPRCAAFYRGFFGFIPLTPLATSPTYCELDAGGGVIAFHQAYGPDGPRTEPTGDPGNPHKLVLEVDGLADTHARLVAAGVRVLPIADGRFDAFDVEEHRFQVVQR